MKLSSKIYSSLVFAILFAPILVLLVFSFNEAKSLSVFSGFSLKWYRELLNDRNTLEAVRKLLKEKISDAYAFQCGVICIDTFAAAALLDLVEKELNAGGEPDGA